MNGSKIMRMNKKGFTLIEMIVVLGIIAIIAGIAIPNFSSWLPNYRIKSAAQELLSNFQLAKITAVKRNANCTITFSVPSLNKYITVDGIKYDYVIYVEPKDVNFNYNAGDDVIVTKKRWVDYDKNIVFDASKGGGKGVDFPYNDSDLPTISFRSNGFPVDKDNQLKGGSVFIKNNKNRSMTINVTAGGSVSIN
jgi:prepilin-type N-terminal cleavage/methylation domain-containing protein